MSELASAGQLRAGYLRWAMFLVPGVLLLGILSSAIAGSGPGNSWFSALAKPSTYPPPAVFSIANTVLYVLMGLALAMIVSARGAPLRAAALTAFAVQLALNLIWSPVFFASHNISGALVVVLLLNVAVLATLALFWKVRPLAGWLLVPYLAWILFAAVLNWQFLQLNSRVDVGERLGPSERIEFTPQK